MASKPERPTIHANCTISSDKLEVVYIGAGPALDPIARVGFLIESNGGSTDSSAYVSLEDARRIFNWLGVVLHRYPGES